MCDPTDCSLPGSSEHGILQARILGWVAMPSSGDLPDSGIKPASLTVSLHWQVGSLPLVPPGKPIMGYYSAIKKEGNNAIGSNMDGLRDCHTEGGKSWKDKYDIAHMWNLVFKSDTNKLIYKTETDLWMLKTNMVTKKEEGEE